MIIVVALKAEATPLVNYYRLKPKSQLTYPYYCSAEHGNASDVSVLVCGMGLAKTKLALEAFLLEHPETLQQGWLNFGVAGGANYPLGELVWVDRVNMGDGFNAVKLPLSQQSGASLRSVAEPMNLSQNVEQSSVDLYDMEFATISEQLLARGVEPMCAKVVSDNKHVSVDELTSQKITDLIRFRLPEVLATCSLL